MFCGNECFRAAIITCVSTYLQTLARVRVLPLTGDSLVVRLFFRLFVFVCFGPFIFLLCSFLFFVSVVLYARELRV